MPRRIAIVALMLAMTPQPARVQALPPGTPLRLLSTGDEGRGWEGVGRLDIRGQGFCTAALVAPDEILTAAHCLYDRSTGKAVEPGRMEFLAGWRMGRAAAYRGIRQVAVPPGYRYSAREDPSRIGNDIALLKLVRPIRRATIRPFEIDPTVDAGDPVGVVSYARGRAQAPSLQKLCHVLRKDRGVLVLDCTVDFGSSGAPVFTLGGGPARIVSMISAKALVRRRPVALGVDLGAVLPVLRAEMRALAAGRFRRVDTTGLPPAGIRDGGAKFVRPGADGPARSPRSGGGQAAIARPPEAPQTP